jgi:hypothetical protein
MTDTATIRLPDLIIVGAMKAGTSSLGYYLGEHPEVFVPSGEASFFSRDDLWRQGASFYGSFLADHRGKRLVGDRSPDYSYAPSASPSVPERIAALLPQVRLIWCLRNPVERAYSHYWHAVTRGFEWRSFRLALWSEARRAAEPYRAYRDRGMYAAQVRQFLAFFPPERMAFVLTENLEANPDAVLAGLYSFLGVDPGFVNQRIEERRNPSRRLIGPVWAAPWVIRYLRSRRPRRRRLLLERWGYPRPPLAGDIRHRLRAFYAPYNDELAQLTGLDLSGWEEDR